ncbi:MAG: DUF58 domain-containing protein [Bacteroidetes bacterium]|nr:DUF58 domain-containing protein [Bacteroidota bacterium]MBS1540097.1 DUF58 domain-containing protein [Bacteroidota bacterium]
MDKSVSLSALLKSSSYWSKWLGVRWQLILTLAVIWLASLWLRNEYGQDDSNLWLVMNQFFLLLQWAIVGLFAFSLLSALLVWGYFHLVIKSKADLQVKFGDGQKAEAGWVNVSVSLAGAALRPLLGTIQARLVFADKKLSAPIILDSQITRPRHIWRQAIQGAGQTLLHDRGIYDIQKVLISFCDMFGLVSLPCSISFVQQLYTLPVASEPQTIKSYPHSTEEQKHRIDVPKRVEGEYVNYKEYETGDNIHRIVWKIYAKNGELVVRIPEVKDPYASHLYFYVSYFNKLGLPEGAFEAELLNVYKDRVRNLLEALQRNDYAVRLPHDQEIPTLAGVGDKHTELYQITASSWQNQTAPQAFIRYNQAAFVCMSSLVPADEIETVVRNLPPAIPLVIVKLSSAIPSPFNISMKDIFFRPEKKPADNLRQPWLISGLRKSLIKNETKISEAIRQRDNTWLTDRIDLHS